MTINTSTIPRIPTDKELIDLEERLWEAMKSRDGRAVAAMTADGSVVVGASGAMAIDGATLAGMVQAAPYELESWRIDPASVKVVRLAEDIALIAYRVHEDLVVEGDKVSLDAHDASVWRRTGDDDWACVLHTESIAGDPFGRDRRKD